ncbi:MAG: methyltransferase domain-containing protein [bacterium]|nr:methyltransferase domain-containing protein [bacterium]
MSKLSKALRYALNGRRLGRSNARTPCICPEISRPGSANVYRHGDPVDCEGLSYPIHRPVGECSRLTSSLCTLDQLQSPAFRYWTQQLKADWMPHRKLWEHCFILQALYERGLLNEGRRGLGFAVGQEVLPALMAQLGCEILASDLDVGDERSQVWAETDQLASTLEGLNASGICEPEKFRQKVRFRSIDMNCIPQDVIGFDFTWSSCSFEHCGSIKAGLRFLRQQMRCLKPGGVAVHTTEFNLSSLEQTVHSGQTVIFRKQDIEAIVTDLQQEGHSVEPLQLDLGSSEEDGQIDVMPYSFAPHLKLVLFERFVTTSIALIIRKSQAGLQQSKDSAAA